MNLKNGKLRLKYTSDFQVAYDRETLLGDLAVVRFPISPQFERESFTVLSYSEGYQVQPGQRVLTLGYPGGFIPGYRKEPPFFPDYPFFQEFSVTSQ